MKNFAMLLLAAPILLVGCKKDEVPTKADVTNITVTAFPQTNDGATWDPSDDADLFIKFAENSSVIWTATTVHENAVSTSEYAFSPSSAISISNLANEIQIDFYDEDGATDEWMGGILFKFDDYKSSSPNPLTLTTNSGDFSVKIGLDWKTE